MHCIRRPSSAHGSTSSSMGAQHSFIQARSRRGVHRWEASPLPLGIHLGCMAQTGCDPRQLSADLSGGSRLTGLMLDNRYLSSAPTAAADLAACRWLHLEAGGPGPGEGGGAGEHAGIAGNGGGRCRRHTRHLGGLGGGGASNSRASGGWMSLTSRIVRWCSAVSAGSWLHTCTSACSLPSLG